jgi:hypothetical protein
MNGAIEPVGTHRIVDGDYVCPCCGSLTWDGDACAECVYRWRPDADATTEAIARIEARLRRIESMPLTVHSPKLAAEMRNHVAAIRVELGRIR